LTRRVRGFAALIALSAVLLSVGCAVNRSMWMPEGGAEVTLTFGGDVNFQGRVVNLLGSPRTAFGPAASLLSAGDVTIVNLETPITSRGKAEPKRYLFRAPDAAAGALKSAGIDAINLANNHSMDYGRVGLADTIAAAGKAGLGVFGAGKDADAAYSPWRTTVRGVRIAVFGFSQVDDLATEWAARADRSGVAMAFDVDRAVQAVAAARANSDIIVVTPHWGIEGDRCPSPLQEQFAERLVQAGADIIVGAHVHVLQGAGRLGDAYVAYGLGNLMWYTSGLFPPFSARAGVLTLTVRGRSVVRSDFTPTVVSQTGQPRALSGWQATLARNNYAQLRTCTDLR